MTKEKDISKMETLTEQWKNGTLKEGWYYYKTSDGRNDIATEYGLYCVEADNNVELEVLAPVPSYEEWEELQESNDGLSKLMFKSLMNKFVKADEERERLEEQLNIATKALREYADESSWVDCKTADDDFEYVERKCAWYTYGYKTAQKALKEIDEVLK